MNNFEKIKEKKSFLKGLKYGLWFEYYIFFVKGLSKTIGILNYQGRELEYELYALTGLIGIICVGEITNVIYRTVIDNKWGLLHLKLINGINIFSYTLSKSFYALVGINIQIPILLLFTKFTNKISVLNLIVGYFIIIVITLFWVNLGILIAIKIPNYKIRDLIVNVLLLPIYFSAPAYYVLSDVGGTIKMIAYLNPLTYQLAGLREAMLFLNFNKDVLILILMTLIISIINFLIIRNVKFVRSEK